LPGKLKGAATMAAVVVPEWDKKGAAVAGGSKLITGGVKQSGQEPLNVHMKMDDMSNDRESLTTS